MQILMHNLKDFQLCLGAKCFSHAPLGLVGKLNGTTPFPELFWLKLLEKCSGKHFALVNVIIFHQGCARGAFTQQQQGISRHCCDRNSLAIFPFLRLVHGTKLASGD